MPISQKKNYDILIIGAGLSGSVTALKAAQNGLSVLLVEKYEHIGGSGNYVEGVFAVDSLLQKKANISVSGKAILSHEIEYSHYKSDGLIWGKYIKSSADMINWLMKQGVKFTSVRGKASGPKTWHIFHGKGKEVIHDIIIPKAEKLGVELITNTEVAKIGQDSNSHIRSVILQNTRNESKNVTVKAVVIATGGYLNNLQFLKGETRNSNRIMPINSGKNKGDGLKLAWSIGAQKYRLGVIMLCGGYLADQNKPTYVYRTSHLNAAATRQSLLWVNEDGDRFVDEAVTDDFSHAGNAISSQNKVFSILDQNTVDYLTSKGLVRPLRLGGKKLNSLPRLQNEINETFSKNNSFAFKADTIDALSKQTGLINLKQSVNHYNVFCKNKKDTDFNKDPHYLVSISKPPFYAFELNIGAYCTIGGLKVNAQNNVLDNKGGKIFGLYAVGNDAAGKLVGDTYCIGVPGSEAGYSIYSGINTANAVTEYINKYAWC